MAKVLERHLRPVLSGSYSKFREDVMGLLKDSGSADGDELMALRVIGTEWA